MPVRAARIVSRGRRDFANHRRARYKLFSTVMTFHLVVHNATGAT
jgi:hypothetical protein